MWALRASAYDVLAALVVLFAVDLSISRGQRNSTCFHHSSRLFIGVHILSVFYSLSLRWRCSVVSAFFTLHPLCTCLFFVDHLLACENTSTFLSSTVHGDRYSDNERQTWRRQCLVCSSCNLTLNASVSDDVRWWDSLCVSPSGISQSSSVRCVSSNALTRLLQTNRHECMPFVKRKEKRRKKKKRCSDSRVSCRQVKLHRDTVSLELPQVAEFVSLHMEHSWRLLNTVSHQSPVWQIQSDCAMSRGTTSFSFSFSSGYICREIVAVVQSTASTHTWEHTLTVTLIAV